MKDGEMDYLGYTPRELREALESINPAVYPKNYARLRAAYLLAFPQSDIAPEEPAHGMQDEGPGQLQYAGFWLRFGAMWLDLLAFLPVIALSLYLSEGHRLFHLYWLVPGAVIGIWFNIYLVFRYGGTPGKILLGLRVAMVDGSSVTLKAAFLRHVVLLVLATLSSIGVVVATLRMSDAQYLQLDFMGRAEAMTALAPRWYHVVSMLSHAWVWSEFLTMLFNRRRRAIHDFMAGTVVIKVMRAS